MPAAHGLANSYHKQKIPIRQVRVCAKKAYPDLVIRPYFQTNTLQDQNRHRWEQAIACVFQQHAAHHVQRAAVAEHGGPGIRRRVIAEQREAQRAAAGK